MKKGIIILTMLATFMLAPIVKADTIINITYGDNSGHSELYYLNNLSWSYWYYKDNNEEEVQTACTSRLDCYNQAINYFISSNKQYYSMFLEINPQNNAIELHIETFNITSSNTIVENVFSAGGGNISRFFFSDKPFPNNTINYATILDGYSDPYSNNFYKFYDSNYNFINTDDYIFKGFFENENNEYTNMLQVHDNETMPKIKDLMEYNSWTDYENNHLENYTEVNLDNYEYVLLTLKNYNQTDAFQTNLQVKGQIGITPIYNYGQTSKDAVTGSQVQDRCNIEYSNYTSYPFYILQTDLQNNVIYAVKECSQGSSFKFDNTVFDVTYVTEENKDNPKVTINGNTYDVIPYSDLPSTATKNEEDNYIPGQSGSATDTGGLDSAIKKAQQKMSEIWNTFTYFTDFINQIFSVFPDEVKTILLSAFTIMIVIGLIKIFIGK